MLRQKEKKENQAKLLLLVLTEIDELEKKILVYQLRARKVLKENKVYKEYKVRKVNKVYLDLKATLGRMERQVIFTSSILL